LQATDLELQIKPSPPRQDINELPLRDAEAALTNRKSELSALPNRIKSEMLAIESDIRNLNSIIELMQTKQSQELGHAIVESNKIESLESKGLAEFKNELSKAEIMSETSEKALTDAAEDLEKQKATKESIQQIISSKADEMTILQDLSELFGSKGYRSVYFDSMISRISDKAGSLMSIMTDGVYSTRLEQIGSDSKGNSKVILKPYITKGGQDVPPDDMSGGAEDRAMLAYDIAIGEIDSDGPPLFLDESVGGIDYVGKMEMMTLLEEVSRHRPVIVIDHSESFKAAFTNIISIDYSKGNSVLGTENKKEDLYEQQ
jgi:DNA repair exonuclease SbcCD ATPase subunit